MTKGSYKVGEDGASPPRRDTSYRSFICILLIFLLICLIILLASINWGGKNKSGAEDGYARSAQTKNKERKELSEDQTQTPRRNMTHDKIRVLETTTVQSVRRTTVFRKEVETTIPYNFDREKSQSTAKESEYITEKNDKRDSTEKSVLLGKIESAASTTESGDITTTLTPEVTIDDTRSTREKLKITSTNSTTARDEIFTTEETAQTSTDFAKLVSSVNNESSIESVTHDSVTTIEEDSTTLRNYNEPWVRTTTLAETTEKKEITAKITSDFDSTTENFSDIWSTTENLKITSTHSTIAPVEKFTTEETAQTSTDFAKLVSSVNNETSTESAEPTTKTASDFDSTTENFTETTTETETTAETEKVAAPLTITAPPTVKNASKVSSTTKIVDSPETTTETKIVVVDGATTITPTTRNVTTSTSTTEISINESESIFEAVTLRMASVPPKNVSNPACQSAVCKTAASRMLSMMNHSAQLCDDFYEFACGNSYEIEEESNEFMDRIVLEKQLNTIENSSAKYLTDFKLFYESCMERDDSFNYRKRMNGLEELLDSVGQFQFNSSDEVNLTDLFSSLLLRQSMPLFDIGLDVDKQSSNFILQLNLPEQSFLRTGLDNWSGLSLLKNRCLQQQKSEIHGSHVNLTIIYDFFQDCQKDYSSYLDSVAAVVEELKAFSNLEPEQLNREITKLKMSIEWQVLINHASLPPSAEILSNFINKNYGLRKVSDLQIHYPILDWKAMLQTVTGHQVSSSTLVQVYFEQYFQNMFTGLAKVDKRELHNALLAIHAHDLFINTVLPKEKSTPDGFCTDLSKKLFPDVWSHLVDKSVSGREKDYDNNQVTVLFTDLKKRFCRSLFEAEWIDDDTKPSVMTKCNDLYLALFTKPESTTLVENYKNFNLTGNYQKDLINSLENFKKNVYTTAGKPVSATTIFTYFMDPLSAKPLTFYASSMIAVPLGLMKRAPRGLPDYLVKTRVGFALARQLARHFDETGMKYGIRLTSTSSASYSQFISSMTMLMDQSSPRLFQHKNISFELNGALSVNERIVDNTAFRLIFDSINFDTYGDLLPWVTEQYSRRTVFFIATAQEFCKKTSMLEFMLQVFEKRHLPAVLRVENIIGNSEQFDSNFQCPTGSGVVFPEKLQFPFLQTVENDYDFSTNK